MFNTDPYLMVPIDQVRHYTINTPSHGRPALRARRVPARVIRDDIHKAFYIWSLIQLHKESEWEMSNDDTSRPRTNPINLFGSLPLFFIAHLCHSLG
jgi:hypothetical protein